MTEIKWYEWGYMIDGHRVPWRKPDCDNRIAWSYINEEVDSMEGAKVHMPVLTVREHNFIVQALYALDRECQQAYKEETDPKERRVHMQDSAQIKELIKKVS